MAIEQFMNCISCRIWFLIRNKSRPKSGWYATQTRPSRKRSHECLVRLSLFTKLLRMSASEPTYPQPSPFAKDYNQTLLLIHAFIHQITDDTTIPDEIYSFCCRFYYIAHEYDDNFDLNDIMIINKCIGRGKTADVHHAMYKDNYHIALKQYKCFYGINDEILTIFNREIKLLKKLQHPNIVLLIGHYINKEKCKLYVAMEWISNGHLYDLLFFSQNKYIKYFDKLLILIDIVRGMKYIHDNLIIHCDLKLHNLLLDKQNRIKIADFGYSIQLNSINDKILDHSKIVHGGYMAPELMIEYNDDGTIKFDGFDIKIDIFNFGVILWEIYERKNAFDQRCFRYKQNLLNGDRPKISENCDVEYKQLIIKCWATDSHERPDFDYILKKLLMIYQQNK